MSRTGEDISRIVTVEKRFLLFFMRGSAVNMAVKQHGSEGWAAGVQIHGRYT